MNILIIIGVLLIVLVAVGTTVALMVNQQKERKARAMAVIKGQKYANEKSDKDNPNKRRAELAKKLKEAGQSEDEGGLQRKRGMLSLLQQAGMSEVSVTHFWMGSIVFGLVLALFTNVILKTSIFVTLMALVTGIFGIPRLFLKIKIGKRQKKFLAEFPDVLEAMVRLLKAGMPVSEAIAMAGKEFTGPVGEEMTTIYEAQKIGIPLPDAAIEASYRVPITEMQMFATGIAIQAQTGASLSEVLMNLSNVIRSRFKLKRKVQALSQEAKSSAAIIGALPFLIGGGLSAINPDYLDPLFTTTAGKITLIGSAVWMSIGIMVMKIMINFKV